MVDLYGAPQIRPDDLVNTQQPGEVWANFVFRVTNFRRCVVILQPSGERYGIAYTSLLDGVSSLDFGPAPCGAFLFGGVLLYSCRGLPAGRGTGGPRLIEGGSPSISKNDHNPVKQRAIRFDIIQSVVKPVQPLFISAAQPTELIHDPNDPRFQAIHEASHERWHPMRHWPHC
jgi:hypothetical protein